MGYKFNPLSGQFDIAGSGSGGSVSSVSNSDGTLTISPTTGAVVASINLGNANTWAARQDNTEIFVNNANIEWPSNDVIIAAAGIDGGGGAWIGFKWNHTDSRAYLQDETSALYGLGVDAIYANNATISNNISSNSLTLSGVINKQVLYSNSTSIEGDVGFEWLNTDNYLLISNASITPTNRLHLHDSGVTSLYSQFTNSSTGSTSTDGFKVGITTAGVAEIRQQESLNLDFYTANTLWLSLTSGGNFVYDTNLIFGDATNNTVGIGTTRSGAISTTNPRLRIFSSGSSSTTTSFEIMNAGSASRLMFRDDGKLWLGDGTASYNEGLNITTSGVQVGVVLQTAATGSASTDGFRLQYSDSIGIRYLSYEANPHIFYISSTEVARFSNTGAIMQITGTLAAQYTGAGSSRGGTISLVSSAGTPQDWYMAVAGNDNAIVDGRSWFLYDNTNSVARFFVDTNGNVGAGLLTTAAAARFHARSTAYASFRGDYDASNYFTITPSAAGVITLDAVGASASFIFSDDVSVPDEAYGVGWNGSLEVPTKNAVYDKIESLSPGGSGNSVTATLAFGASFTDKAQTVITGQTWVTANSEITAQVKTPATVDPDEMRLLGFEVVVSDLVVGDGFTVTLYSESEAKDDYDVMCIGV